MRATLHVVERAERGERRGDLERAADPAPAHRVGRQAVSRSPCHAHVAGVGPELAGQHVEQRRLPGAVGADQRADLAGRQRRGSTRRPRARRRTTSRGSGSRAVGRALSRIDAPIEHADEPAREGVTRRIRMAPSTACQYSRVARDHRVEQLVDDRADRRARRSEPTPPSSTITSGSHRHRRVDVHREHAALEEHEHRARRGRRRRRRRRTPRLVARARRRRTASARRA